MSERIEDYNTLRFLELLGTLHETTMAFLGKKANPATGETFVDLRMAQWHIDVLAALEKKTEGNLSDIEKRQLSTILTNLRLNYVDEQEAEKKKAAAEGEGAPPEEGTATEERPEAGE